VLQWKGNNAFPLYCWPTLIWQQYITVVLPWNFYNEFSLSCCLDKKYLVRLLTIGAIFVPRVTSAIFVSDFNQIWRVPTDFFLKIPLYQISPKSVLWEPRCCVRKDGRTDGREEANRRFSRLTPTPIINVLIHSSYFHIQRNAQCAFHC